MDPRTGLPVVGMVGAGQLARMTHQAAIALGQSVRMLAETADDGAALVAPDAMIGDYRNLGDLREFAAGCDVVTFDHEHVPTEHVQALADSGVVIYPGADALQYAQDKSRMRTRLAELGIAGPAWADLSVVTDAAAAERADFAPGDGAATDSASAVLAASASAASASAASASVDSASADSAWAGHKLAAFTAEHGWPVVLKAVRGGYDGKGVWLVHDADEARAVLATGTALLVEQAVPIARELAAVVARSPFGQGASWPVVQTVQQDGICVEVLAPAPELDAETAETIEATALRIAEELDVVGVLAVELFETTDGEILVNELAMRPHNSGHWTIEGARTSQFEQHLRAVLDYPLGTTTPTAPVVVMVNLLAGPDDVQPAALDERVHHAMARWPDVKIHLYGKHFRRGRKVGHVTALGDELASVRAKARAAADYLVNGGEAHG